MMPRRSEEICRMKTSTSDFSVLKKILKYTGVCVFWLAVWYALCFIVPEDLKLFLPTPFSVLETWIKKGFTAEYLSAAAKSLIRIFTGFAVGTVSGVLIGIFTSLFTPAEALLSPFFKFVRAVPVVSFIILAFLFINESELPVFISCLMVMPLMWQSVHDGIRNENTELDEMCKVYKIGKAKSYLKVKLPLAFPGILSTAVSAVGLAWKSGIAAEVLCTPDVSIGHMIYKAKANLSFDEVYAETLTVVALSIIFEIVLKYIFKKYSERKTEK